MLVICPHPENRVPGQRLKYEQYFEHFRKNGIEVTVKPFMTDRFQDIVYKKGHFIQKIGWTIYGYLSRLMLLFSVRKYDVSYIFLWVTPFGPPLFEWMVRKLSRSVIYDIDDLVYLAESKSNANSLISKLKGRGKPIFMMKVADHVITCTPYLDQFVRNYNTHTTDISSTIDTARYVTKADYSINDRKVVLGWSGSYSTSKYLYLLKPVFERLTAEKIPFKLLVMGDPSFSIDGVEVEALEWKDSYETEIIGRFDIGLYPLPDEQWVYGKSGLKALQYMAMGVPTIAAAIGTNFRIIENNMNGFLARNEEEWFAYIKELIKDETLRKRIGTAGREVVNTKFSIIANQDTYLSVVNSVLRS